MESHERCVIKSIVMKYAWETCQMSFANKASYKKVEKFYKKKVILHIDYIGNFSL